MAVPRVPLLIILTGTLIPPTVAIVALLFVTSMQYRPTSLLIAQTVTAIVPFAVLAAIVRTDLQRVESGQATLSRALLTAWIPCALMTALAVAADIASEMASLGHDSGASTNAVVAVTLPIALMLLGLCTYILTLAFTALVGYLHRKLWPLPP
jgi:hypothetical protein